MTVTIKLADLWKSALGYMSLRPAECALWCYCGAYEGCPWLRYMLVRIHIQMMP